MLTGSGERGAGAGEDGYFRALRAIEFSYLDARRLTYLDYTGAALPSISQMRAHDQLLHENVFGNPHSEHSASRDSSAAIERARAAVLRFLHADPEEYAVCFTANTSAAAKLVGESFGFGANSRFVLSADNHNSINGIREYARRAGATIATVPLDAELRLRDANANLAGARARDANLFAFPAQSNFSGVRHPLSLVPAAQRLGYSVLLDAAAYAPSSTLDLSVIRPEFVTLSFYKIFGFPTGVGALIARRDALAALRRPWFAGGTVDWVSVHHDVHALRSGVGALEDGTPNYFGIAALESGFAHMENVRIDRLSSRVRVLTAALLAELERRRHHGGAPIFEIYGPRGLDARGGIVALNVRDAAGRILPYEDVEVRASAARVAVRGGCFCNPGAAESAFAFPAGESLVCLRQATHRGFTPRRFAECLGDGTAVGAIRISVGTATSDDDIVRGVDVLEEIAIAVVSGTLEKVPA